MTPIKIILPKTKLGKAYFKYLEKKAKQK